MIRPLVLYPVLVGVPALGVLAVLRVGARLEAPPSVGGAWSVEAAARAVDPACAARLAPAALRVTQSGTHLSLAWGGPRAATLRGTLDGAALSAVEAGPGGAGCAGPLRVEARLGAGRVPATMEGTVSVDGCAACARSAFHATRQAPARRGGARGH
jgi:hypothetical protein